MEIDAHSLTNHLMFIAYGIDDKQRVNNANDVDSLSDAKAHYNPVKWYVCVFLLNKDNGTIRTLSC